MAAPVPNPYFGKIIDDVIGTLGRSIGHFGQAIGHVGQSVGSLYGKDGYGSNGLYGESITFFGGGPISSPSPEGGMK
jgi:hypothetical protein